MKKHIKIFLAAILIFSFCVSLCGCKTLDELKKAQAFFSEDGNIIYNNNNYIKTATRSDIENFSYITDKDLNVTTPDVPVLLSGFSSDYGYRIGYNNKIIISGDDNIYCREDYLEQFKKIIAENKTDNYFASTYTSNSLYYDEDGNSVKVFKDSEKEKIKKVLSSEKIKYSEKIKNYIINGEYTEMGVCSKDYLLASTDYLLLKYKTGYYIFPYNNTFYQVWDDGVSKKELDTLYYYEVPTGYNYIFNPIFQ